MCLWHNNFDVFKGNGLRVKNLRCQGVEANDLQNGRDFGRKMVADGIHLTQIGHWFKKK